MKKEILTPEHGLWEEFFSRLSGPQGCNFRFDPAKGYVWNCKGGNNKDIARAILEDMPSIDVEGTLAYFDARGHHCDCKVMFNAAASELDTELH